MRLTPTAWARNSPLGVKSPVNPLPKLGNTLSRQFLARACSGWRPYYIVNEFPKCGGSWIGEMIAQALDVPFPRNRFPSLQRSILHGHFLHPQGLRNVVMVWRDPRDMFVSLYYHSYFRNELYNGPLVDQMRRDLPFDDYNDIQRNLPVFLDAHFQRRIWPHYTWNDFYTHWQNRPVAAATSYEAMRRDTPGELARVAQKLTGHPLDRRQAQAIADDHAFARKAKRAAGQADNNSFLRKGVVGDWVNSFTPDSLAILDRHAGQAMAELGYADTSRTASPKP